MPDTTPPAASTTTPSKGRTTASASSAKTDAPRKLHFVLQGKGGVGKTVVALLLSQCIQEKGEPVNTGILRVQKSRLFKLRQSLWPQIERVI